MTTSLVLTLGHNASAIAVEDGVILAGYEEERFTNRKSDSSFPMKAIQRIQHLIQADRFDSVCVGHWFTGGKIVDSKYIDLPFINNLVDHPSHIHSIHDDFSHHDSHMLSAEVFADYYKFPEDRMTIVADGFGTYGECISIYACKSGSKKLLVRHFGYDKSLGLLYQYATAFLGMKMNNHEYKMLGYEAHIDTIINPATKHILIDEINIAANAWVKNIFNGSINRDMDPIVNVAALATTQSCINEVLKEVLNNVDPSNSFTEFQKRVVVSYFVQNIVESVILTIVGVYRPENLVVSGGLFYNVKLNHALSKRVEKLCVMPLAGDQGAGLGVYQQVYGDLKWPGHLFWGHRNLDFDSDIENIESKQHYEDCIGTIVDELETAGYVNIVRGSMEFGPRSLCNTATLAIPNEDIVNKINAMNDRTTIMPMAPVMLQEQADEILIDNDKIVGSLEYMIVTRDVKPEMVNEIKGASHYYTETGKSTCRPQIITKFDSLLVPLLEEFGPLINTSFNYHGVPIVFDRESIEYSHKQQNQKFPIKTVVIK